MNYTEVDLGRPASFLIPSLKLKGTDKEQRKIEDKIHVFLLENFSGYTVRDGVYGYWKVDEKVFYGEHKEYRVSFKGKERIPLLKQFLAEITHEIEEQCLYIETGEDSFLNLPKPTE